MKTLAFCNQKGGVAKTTSATCTAKILADDGKRVLLVDMDPQGNATDVFNVNTDDEYTVFELLKNECMIADTIKTSRGVDIVPADIALASLEPMLASATSRERRLIKHLVTIQDEYDVCILDCPPSLSLLTVMALTAADYVVVPADMGRHALKGFDQLAATVEMIKEDLNPNLAILGILLTKYNPRTNIGVATAERAAELAGQVEGCKVFETYIPTSVSVPNADNKSLTGYEADSKSKPSLAYQEFVKKVIDKLSI